MPQKKSTLIWAKHSHSKMNRHQFKWQFFAFFKPLPPPLHFSVMWLYIMDGCLFNTICYPDPYKFYCNQSIVCLFCYTMKPLTFNITSHWNGKNNKLREEPPKSSENRKKRGNERTTRKRVPRGRGGGGHGWKNPICWANSTIHQIYVYNDIRATFRRFLYDFFCSYYVVVTNSTFSTIISTPIPS